ncbi:hypothetical protein CIG79_21835 [Escherichia coli]|nr:hypothetical protein [Escherichia coli]EFA5490896.1 hypothetical protein [Escherichia coli]EFC0660918.1 hypothetical protein [Escherichia coli]EFC1627178.1 hypothetical protein [Escherichia coli]EFD1025765.1 hypothetical protein [Escherichia coli]
MTISSMIHAEHALSMSALGTKRTVGRTARSAMSEQQKFATVYSEESVVLTLPRIYEWVSVN